MTIRFKFNEEKAVEAMVYIASKSPSVTAFYMSKIFYFAEKTHLNKYGRPIVADTFYAMSNGPVPSAIYDFIKGDFDKSGNPKLIVDSLTFGNNRYREMNAKRKPNLEVLSLSDLECLDEAIAFCSDKKFTYLSRITHNDDAWKMVELNDPMDYFLMIERDSREKMREELEEFALYGVL